MQIGIVNFGAYIPLHRISKRVIGEMWGRAVGRGEKAVANWDEDSLTMAIESCIDSMVGCDRDSIDGILFASTTPPYREKQSASLMRKVLNLRPITFSADICNSLRGGTIGLKIAMDAVKAGAGKKYLVAASDLRISAPNSDLELEFGDGAAALMVGCEDVVATINAHQTVCSEFIDIWRRDKDSYTQMWEDRFALTEGYQKIMVQSLKDFFNKLSIRPEDYTMAAIYAPNLRALRAVSRKVGLEFGKQISTRLFGDVGNTGNAFAFMMFIEALEKSKPGDRILLAAYGDGVDLFDFKVTEKITDTTRGRGIKKHLASSAPLESYGGYLRFRNLLEWGFDRRPPDRTSLPILNRESSQIYSLHGS
ncbi:MAG: 3-oxoacyl-[acyl-carrier-protein] synthase III C-terminal domain-containing protein, partial [Candidatus Hodarchaeota archaeon]